MTSRRAVAPVIATLLLVAIAVVGGSIVFVFSQGFFSSAQISGSPNIESLKIVGYDATDGPVLQIHDGLESGVDDFGILICGSGNGINMAANSHSGIRSALCWQSDIASLARQHNNANVMALPGRFIDNDEAMKCIDNFLNTEYEGGRHDARVSKIKYE